MLVNILKSLKLKDLTKMITFPFLVYLLGYGLEIGVPTYTANILTWPNRVVHFLGGLSIAVLAYFILDLIKKEKMISTSSKVIDFLLILFFVMSVAASWEFYEYFSDMFFGTHAQLSLDDTMKDMIMGTLGALTFGIGWIVSKFFKPSKTIDIT